MEESKQINESKGWKRIEKRGWLMLVLFLLGSLYFLSLKISLSVLLGGALAILNFRLLAMKLTSYTDPKEENSKSGLVFFAMFKYPLFFLLIGFLILKTPIHLIGFMVGFLSLVFAIFGEGVFPPKKQFIN